MHLHPGVHVDGEVLERQHHEEREHRAADVPPVLRQLVVEERPADHAVDEQQHRGREADREERRDAPPDAREKHAEVGEETHDSDDACEPGETKQRRGLADAGDERDGDHDEVEHVPAAAEELQGATSVGADPDRKLDHEDPEADVVDEVERLAEAILDPVVRLEPERDGVGEDHHQDDGREPGCGDDAGEAGGHQPEIA